MQSVQVFALLDVRITALQVCAAQSAAMPVSGGTVTTTKQLCSLHEDNLTHAPAAEYFAIMVLIMYQCKVR